jgi:predicted dinucleotide-binding enzyme
LHQQSEAFGRGEPVITLHHRLSSAAKLIAAFGGRKELQMQIAVLGTGIVGRTLAGAAARAGHDVAIGTRDPEATLARTEGDAMGNPPYSVWQADHPDVALLPFAEAAARGELVVNATSGGNSLDVLAQAGPDNLAGKVLIDVANPLDFSAGFPPTLSVKDTDSLAEQIQRALPDAKVVKTLNTMNATLMADPAALAGGDHSVFVSGDDAAAKATVTELLRGFGWQDVIDLGDLSSARGAEMLLPVWLRLMGTLGTPAFNFKIVR